MFSEKNENIATEYSLSKLIFHLFAKFCTKKKYCTQHLKIKLQDTMHKQHWEIELIKYFILNTHSNIIIQSVQQKVAKLRT
jgi:hypothetical protein